MNNESSFFSHSKKITEEFLSTAVIFDDQANFGDYSSIKPKIVISPPTRKKSSDKTGMASKEFPTKIDGGSVEQSHDLNAKKVIDSFAKKGILCSVIKPEEHELEFLHETVTPLCKNVDLIIFDWELSRFSEKTSLPLVKDTIKLFNSSCPQQLRLIAIYTGATDTDKVFDQVKEELKIDCQIENINGNCCQIGACRLLVFAKKAAKTAEGVTKISFEELADFLVEEYTKMTNGLLSNVVMNSFSVIKQNTHQILKKFSGLDSPFLTHRTCLPNPEEAEEHSATLISEEIQSLLEEYNVGKVSDLNALQYYFDDQPESKKYSLKSFNIKDELLTRKQALGLWEQGILKRPDFLSQSKIKNEMIFKFLTGIYSGDEDGEILDLKYAALTTLRSKYSDSLPYLTLGIIVKELSDQEKYWICLQPRCDSVRLSGDTSFPFLPVSDKGKIHCVIPDGSNSFVRKKISLKFSDCRKIIFPVDPITKFVQATAAESEFFFQDTQNNKFQFICELKTEYAQNISNSFASNISRVATNNSEWLRRCEQKNL